MSEKHALIIGNSDYDDSNLAKLLTPDADVNAFAEVLRDPQVGAFDHVITLVNQPSTTIRREIANFFVGRGREDLLLLYFSGHGIRDDLGQLFLAVKDTEHQLLRGTAIPASFITEEMDNSRSRRQVLILDCCHSGAFSKGMKAASEVSVGTESAFRGTGSGRVVLTATDSTQYAWEGDQVIGQSENSVFTHHLIQGLSSGEADNDADGKITLDELYNYVYEQVVYETPRQTPGKWSYGQQGEIVIATNPHPVVKPVGLPADLEQTIDDSRPWVREGAVQELDRILRGNNPGLSLTAYEALKRLAEDDSRRVASKAAECLAAYQEANPPGVFKEQAIQTGLINQEENASVLNKPVEANSRAPEKFTLQQPVPAGVDREPLAQEQSGLIAQTDEKSAQRAPQNAAELIRSLIPVEMVTPLLTTITGWAIAWGFGWVVSEALGWQGSSYDITWLIIATTGGLITALALRRAEPSVKWSHILLITIGWAIGMIVGATVSMALFQTTENPINGFLRGAVAGFIIGLVLRRTDRSIHWIQALWISLGWAIAWAIGEFIGPILYDNLDAIIGGNIGLWILPGAIMGGISAAIGSIVMFWQLSKGKAETGELRF